MKNTIPLIIAIILIFSINCSKADDSQKWKKTANEYLSSVVHFACVEKRNPMLKKCNIPTDKCKMFADMAFKQCLGYEIAIRQPIKQPQDMSEDELLNVLDKATTCASRDISVLTFYVCPENYNDIYNGGGY